MNRIHTASDFCQGHGGGRDCTYHAESGDCDHGFDFDHGVVSFCDGTCTEARGHYLRYLVELGQAPFVTTRAVAMAAYGNGVSYEVTFEGRDAESRALAYISARKGLHFTEVEDRPFSHTAFPRLAATLHPTCDHGLSADLCMDPLGPNHFGTREQEMTQGW